MRPVVDLLVEQIECADFVLLNKVDLLPGGMEGEALEQLQAIVASLNPLATVIACQDAKVCDCYIAVRAVVLHFGCYETWILQGMYVCVWCVTLVPMHCSTQ